jgi:hypothetical protein
MGPTEQACRVLEQTERKAENDTYDDGRMT